MERTQDGKHLNEFSQKIQPESIKGTYDGMVTSKARSL